LEHSSITGAPTTAARKSVTPRLATVLTVKAKMVLKKSEAATATVNPHTKTGTT
jgi:hypothetical protein